MGTGPLVSIDLAAAEPAYRQIVNDLRRHLVSGALKPGDSLPSVRQLALDLGVHFNTVALAYRALAEEGWLDLRRGRGASVIKRASTRAADPGRVDQLVRRLGELTAELRTAGMTRKQIGLVLRRLATGVER
jgi:GntR family transcriptional regulator